MMTPTNTTLYTVIYRTGGEQHCIWHRGFDTHQSKAMMQKLADDLEKMGYKAHVRTVRELTTIGLPVGWTSDHVDWEHDIVKYSAYRTEHIRRG